MSSTQQKNDFLPCSGLNLPPETIITPAIAGQRLDKVLAGLTAQGSIRAGRRLWQWCRILVNGKAQPCGYRVVAGDTVRVVPMQQSLAGVSLQATVQDLASGTAASCRVSPVASDADHAVPNIRILGCKPPFIALYKPALCHSAHIQGANTQSAEAFIAGHWDSLCKKFSAQTPPGQVQSLPDFPPQLLTRLDYATSGILLAATDSAASQVFRTWEQQKKVTKTYYAFVCGSLRQPLHLSEALDTAHRKTTKILAHTESDPSRHTLVAPLADFSQSREAGTIPPAQTSCTLVQATIYRGARHQIRAHLSNAGFPLVGDRQYGAPLDLQDIMPLLACNNVRLRLSEIPPFLLHYANCSLPCGSLSVAPPWMEPETFRALHTYI